MSEVVHIVLVSEDAGQRRMGAHVLGRAGWLVSEAWDAEMTLELLRRNEIAVVVIDLGHPVDGARSLISEIAGGFPDVPVMAMGPEDVAGAVQAMQRGACDYVGQQTDGAHFTDLPQAVWRALGRRRRLRTQRRARTEPETLATALRGMSDGVAIVDTIGRLSYVNPALASALGTSAPKILGRSISEFVQVPSGDEDGLASVLTQAETDGRWAGQLHHRRDDGPGIWDVTLTPIARPRSAGALVGIFRDAANRDGGDQVRSDFLSMVTHDIKSPLSVILGYTDLLTEVPASPQVIGETLTRIRESGEQINALVSNFLELSRIEAGRLVIERRPTDVRDLVLQVVDQLEARAVRKGLTVEKTVDPMPELDADPQYLERALQNVLSNAVKYTPSGGRISVTLDRTEDGIAIRVADTGQGISPEELPHVFEKFRRARAARRLEGTGLGLYIARRILEAHGGHIEVTSAPGVGSTFVLRLPLPATAS